MDINSEITITLTYKDVALIAVAMGMYQDSIKCTNDEELKNHAKKLTNLLGSKLYNQTPDKWERIFREYEASDKKNSLRTWLKMHYIAVKRD